MDVVFVQDWAEVQQLAQGGNLDILTADQMSYQDVSSAYDMLLASAAGAMQASDGMDHAESEWSSDDFSWEDEEASGTTEVASTDESSTGTGSNDPYCDSWNPTCRPGVGSTTQAMTVRDAAIAIPVFQYALEATFAAATPVGWIVVGVGLVALGSYGAYKAYENPDAIFRWASEKWDAFRGVHTADADSFQADVSDPDLRDVVNGMLTKGGSDDGTYETRDVNNDFIERQLPAIEQAIAREAPYTGIAGSPLPQCGNDPGSACCMKKGREAKLAAGSKHFYRWWNKGHLCKWDAESTLGNDKLVPTITMDQHGQRFCVCVPHERWRTVRVDSSFEELLEELDAFGHKSWTQTVKPPPPPGS